ncbi:hypothetical protein [Klebsiella oxytoca]|uniref:hypothetical protein n=1 Tax=Klebsiella oxytoca TaxID=571 RepID=UPI002246AD98|nr:hypothetical protein [Klebsiella oxytoca]MCW9498688.1 hypothetical protein [Klebsiella oxytoca]
MSLSAVCDCEPACSLAKRSASREASASGAERTVQQSFVEAMLRICPGYRPANDDEPVARATGPQTVMNL